MKTAAREAAAKAACMAHATAKATGMAAAETTAKAAAVAAATAAKAAAAMTAATATTSAATRQRHGRCNQTNRRDCQQRDNRLAQHHHFSVRHITLSHQVICRWRSFWKITTGFEPFVTQLCASRA
jgi:hypothetical protein